MGFTHRFVCTVEVDIPLVWQHTSLTETRLHIIFFCTGSGVAVRAAAEIGSDAGAAAETQSPLLSRPRHQRCHSPHQTRSGHGGVRRAVPGEAGLHAHAARGPGSNVQGRYHSHRGVSELGLGQTSPRLTRKVLSGWFFDEKDNR